MGKSTKQQTNKQNMQIVLCQPTTLGHGAYLPWSVIDIPSDTTLEKTDFFFLICVYQLQIASW